MLLLTDNNTGKRAYIQRVSVGNSRKLEEKRKEDKTRSSPARGEYSMLPSRRERGHLICSLLFTHVILL